MKPIIISVVFLFTAASAEAACNKQGNCYYGNGNGYNYNTGKTWTNKGSSGTDSRGNHWNYNNRTGTYNNYGTGEIRQHRNRW